jgi:alkaline phosphatase
MKRLLCAATIILASTAGNAIENPSIKNVTGVDKPKNIIMVIADGMGPAYTSAYRYFNDDPATELIEETIFDRLVIGSSSTYPARISGLVTDSAAAATALASGVKTYNGAIGLDVNKNRTETVLEFAKIQGKKTGIVVTSQINHATPAAYLAHNTSRQNYNVIANSYIDEGIKADVYFGGGWQYFLREDRNLINEFKAAGFQYIDNYNLLADLNVDKPVIGLFDNVGLPWALDDNDSHRLSTMTKAAIKQLENDQGYFMLIEASQVDWAGHANDISAAMAEMTDLAITMQYLEKYAHQHPDTLVILTADHSTGGLTVGANGKYEWNPEILRVMKQSPTAIATRLGKSKITQQHLSTLLNFSVTKSEVTQIQRAKIYAIEQLASYNQLDDVDKVKVKKPSESRIISTAITKIIDLRTNTGWTSGGHTAIDVPVYAFGKNSKMFAGHLDNTDIAQNIFILLGKE